MQIHAKNFLSSLTLLATLVLTGCPGGGGDTDSEGTTAGSTSNPTSTATMTDGSSSGGAATPTCEDYCSSITTNCSAANAQYADMDSCMGSCKAFPVGTGADTSGNTLGCRIYHAGAAAMDAATHCVHAGPGGGGACGMPCEGFCSIAVATCATEHPDDATCKTTCGGFMDTEPYDAGDVAGDTLACRLYHLTVASSSAANAATHCPHTVAASPPCM